MGGGSDFFWIRVLEQECCGPTLLRVKKRVKAADDAEDPSQAETQALVAGQRRIPRPTPPAALRSVLELLASDPVVPFQHTLQYKKEFRALVQKIKEGSQNPPYVIKILGNGALKEGLTLALAQSHMHALQDPRRQPTFCCKPRRSIMHAGHSISTFFLCRLRLQGKFLSPRRCTRRRLAGNGMSYHRSWAGLAL